MTYTALAVAAVASTVALDLALLRTRLLLRRLFWVSYAIVLAFQLVANGILTGAGIVRYNGSAVVGSGAAAFIGDGRFVWAPVEDLLFGFALVTQTLCWWVFWGRRGVQREPPS